MSRKKILVVFGTRPEAIKMCPLVLELKKRSVFDVVVAVTGQHREMLDQVLELFEVCPKYDLNIMKTNQSLIRMMTAVTEGMDHVLDQERPELTLVHGDTLTAYATAVACFMKGYAVGHVEAGLRTHNLNEPFPEEFNRQSISVIAKYHFAPTKGAQQNLFREGKKEHVYITGNTAIDALRYTVKENYSNPCLQELNGRKLILVTLHRRENWQDPMRHVFHALRRFLEEYEDQVFALFPLHRNPMIRENAMRILGECKNIRLTEPLDVVNCHNIMAESYFVLTDSGGIQEEAPYFGKPVLVARNVTERPEGVEAGVLKLIGTEEEEVYANLKELLENEECYQRMSRAVSPYGDGTASRQIADILEREL